MHDYSIDNHPKEKVIFLLSLIAISVAPLLNTWIAGILHSLDAATGWAFPATAIPVFSLFLAIYWYFNKKLWKYARLRSVLLVPDLNGSWECKGRMVLRNGEPVNFEWAGKVTITQSWSKMLIDLRTLQSGSKSVSASVVRVPSAGYRVLYQYRNDPKAGEDGLAKHDGAAELEFDADCTMATGSYFTDQHRRTVGTMQLMRV